VAVAVAVAMAVAVPAAVGAAVDGDAGFPPHAAEARRSTRGNGSTRRSRYVIASMLVAVAAWAKKRSSGSRFVPLTFIVLNGTVWNASEY
jgi:hypothetical protein